MECITDKTLAIRKKTSRGRGTRDLKKRLKESLRGEQFIHCISCIMFPVATADESPFS